MCEINVIIKNNYANRIGSTDTLAFFCSNKHIIKGSVAVEENLQSISAKPTALVWAGLSKVISAWARARIECQMIKIHQQIHSAVPQVPIPLLGGSLTSTWTLWDLCPILEVSPTCSPSSTGPYLGWRLFLCPPSLLLIVPELSWSSCQDDLRPWSSIHVLHLRCFVLSPEHFRFQDQQISTSVQQPCGMFPLFPEDLSTCSVGRSRLVWPPSLGHEQPPFHS